VKQEVREAADEFALLGLAQALDFLGDRRDIRLADAPGAQEARLFEAPGVKIAVRRVDMTLNLSPQLKAVDG
jgi:hypothetical protein